MDDDGNLVGVRETVNFDEREAADVETTNIRNEMLRETKLKQEETKEAEKENDQRADSIQVEMNDE